MLVKRFAAFLLALIVPWAMPAPAAPLTIGTGSVTGVYYLVGGALCRLVNRDRAATGTTCAVESTGGSVANVQAMAAGDLDFSIVQSDILHRALKGEAPFEGQPLQGLRVAMYLHDEALAIVAPVREQAQARTLMDLRGQRFNIGPQGSGTRVTLAQIGETLGIERAGFATLLELNPESQGRALCAGEIDGFAYQVGQPSENIAAAARLCPVRLLGLEPGAIAEVVRQRPYYRPVVIPGGTYANNPQDVTTLGLSALLVTHARVDAAQVRRVVEATLDNRAEFARLHPTLAKLTPGQMARRHALAAPHDGAHAAFHARNLMD